MRTEAVQYQKDTIQSWKLQDHINKRMTMCMIMDSSIGKKKGVGGLTIQFLK